MCEGEGEGERERERERERESHIPLVCRGDEDSGTIHNSPFDMATLLFVHHQEMVAVQLDSILHSHGFYFQTIEEHLFGPGMESDRSHQYSNIHVYVHVHTYHEHIKDVHCMLQVWRAGVSQHSRTTGTLFLYIR